MSIIHVDHVSYTYKSKYCVVQALDNISLEFDQGKFYALIGKSGSGKSTLLSLLAGLDLAKEGNITFFNKSIDNNNKEEHRREIVSVIYQQYNLFPLLTSIENVTYILELNGMKSKEAKVKAEELLNKVNIKNHCYRHYPHMLSGGEQQRVAIARGLASNAKILLADEPTGNLDSKTSKDIINLFKQLVREEGYTIIMVTHDIDIIKEVDEVYEILDGKLLNNI